MESLLGTRSPEENMPVKYPYKRVEPSIQRFINVCQIDLERVKRHKINLGQMQLAQDWKGLHKEQINASRTIQQLKANLRELKKTRSRVKDNDLEKFDDKVKDVAEESMEAVSELVDLYKQTEVAADGSTSTEGAEKAPLMTSSLHPSMLSSSVPTVDTPATSLEQEQEQLQAQRLAQDSLNNLCTSIEDLNGLMCEFSKMVHEQGEKVDSIEDNIEKTEEDVAKGTDHLAQALRFKAAVYPIAGAVLGGVVGGPVGLLAGLKLGAVAAGVGGIAGFSIGKVVNKMQTSSVEGESSEMEKLERSRSNSSPEINVKDPGVKTEVKELTP